MIRKTFSMTDDIAEIFEGQVRSGLYGNESEYFRDLVRRDWERKKTIARVQKLIDDGIASGVSDKSIEDIWQEALRRHTAETGKNATGKKKPPAKKK